MCVVQSLEVLELTVPHTLVADFMGVNPQLPRLTYLELNAIFEDEYEEEACVNAAVLSGLPSLAVARLTCPCFDL